MEGALLASSSTSAAATAAAAATISFICPSAPPLSFSLSADTATLSSYFYYYNDATSKQQQQQQWYNSQQEQQQQSAYPSYTYHFHLHPLLTITVCVWLALEIGFYYMVHHILVPHLNEQRRPPRNPQLPRDSMFRVLDTVHRLKEVYSWEAFFEGWFAGAKMEDIHAENIKEWLAWTTYHKKWKRLRDVDRAAVEEVMIVMKERYGLIFKPGHNPQVHFPRIALEPIRFSHRLLVFYLVIKLVQMAGGVALRLRGYNHYSTKNGITYWHRSRRPRVRCLSASFSSSPHQQQQHSRRQRRYYFYRFGRSQRRHSRRGSKRDEMEEEDQVGQRIIDPAEEAANRLPLIFFHGISPGLCVYIFMIFRITRERPAVLVEIPHITMLLNFKASRRDLLMNSINEITLAHPHDFANGFAVAGHSFGSIVAGWAARHFPEKVRQLILIDPVCLLLCFPEVAYNFLYRMPSSLLGRVFKVCFGIARELTVSYALRRNFWWYENITWLEDIQCPITVALSGEDGIAPIQAIKEYVLSHGEGRRQGADTSSSTGDGGEGGGDIIGKKQKWDAEVIVWPKFVHGRILFNRKAQEQLMQIIQRQALRCARSPSQIPHFA